MSVSENHVLHHLVVEVKYREGIVYLDKCGSLMLALHKRLGEPFRTSVPQMQYGELASSLERLVVRYGPDSLIVDQHWLETPARVEKLAPLAWQEVSTRLEVGSKILRCGMRAFLLWSADSVDEAQRAIHAAGLVLETPKWESILGTPTRRSFVGLSPGKHGGSLRSVLETVEVVTDGRIFPGEEKFAPRHGIQLDLDFSRGDQESLTKEELQGFLRSNLNEMSRIADSVGRALHARE